MDENPSWEEEPAAEHDTSVDSFFLKCAEEKGKIHQKNFHRHSGKVMQHKTPWKCHWISWNLIGMHGTLWLAWLSKWLTHSWCNSVDGRSWNIKIAFYQWVCCGSGFSTSSERSIYLQLLRLRVPGSVGQQGCEWCWRSSWICWFSGKSDDFSQEIGAKVSTNCSVRFKSGLNNRNFSKILERSENR